MATLLPSALMAQNDKADQNRIEALVRVFFNTNKDILTGQGIDAALAASGEQEAIERGGKKGLQTSLDAVTRMKGNGISYTKGKVMNIDYRSVNIEGDRATATTVVTMEMSIKAGPGAPDRTVFDDAYTFTFAREKNKWVMVDNDYLLPGDLAGPALPTNSKLSLLDSLPDIGSGAPELKTGVNPNPSDRRRGPKSPNDKNGNGGPNGSDEWKMLGTYSASSAASYARQYALAPNSSYRDFGNNCTNFISQCMKAGGWTEVDGSGRQANDAWYYGSFSWTTSYTWGGAHNFYLFQKQGDRAFAASYYSDLIVGDVVSVDMYGPGYSSTQPLDGKADHTIIVTARSSSATSQIFVSYQTSNTLNRPLDEFITRAQGSNGAKLYGWLMWGTY